MYPLDKMSELCLVRAMDKRLTSEDLTGKRFGRLICVKRVKWSIETGVAKTRAPLWVVACDCGAVKIMQGRTLKKGTTISCGCYRAERCKNVLSKLGTWSQSKFPQIHGHSSPRSPTYNSWLAMMSRCYKESDVAYKNYGARGIVVCDEWHNFMNFLSDMKERPNGTTIDRIDVNKSYEPGNCKWSTWDEQNLHKRAKNGHKITT